MCSGGNGIACDYSLGVGHCRLNQVGGRKGYNGTGDGGGDIQR